MALAMAASIASMERPMALRSVFLSVENTCSMGLKSGL